MSQLLSQSKTKDLSPKNIIGNRVQKLYQIKLKNSSTILYFYLNFLLIFGFLNPILSDLGIKISAFHPQESDTYKIIYCNSFPAPNKIYINSNALNTFRISSDRYIYIQSDSQNDNIILVWYSSIEKGIKNYLSSNINNYIEYNSTSYSIRESSVLFARDLFKDCSQIKSVDFNYFDTSLITNMYQMFYSCTSLTTISSLSLENVRSMSYLFYNCYSLYSIGFIKTKTTLVN